MLPQENSPPRIPDYELLRPIGRGTYGEVWLARSVTGVFRVIKIVRRDRFESERPFLRELEGITRFQSAASGRPRQLALLHVGRNEQAGYFYYVMEPADDAETGSAIDPDRYVPLTLKELLYRRGRLPASEAVQLALELARGLAILHEAGLIHRDIKPSNIIFVQGVPKLADVGLVAPSEQSMTGVGTPGYIPPEGPGAAAADIYGLGKVIYEIFTGNDRRAFPDLPPEMGETTEEPLLIELNAVVVTACHPDPRSRQPSAAALARQLELVQAGKSVAFYERLRRRSRHIAIGAIAVCLVAGAILSLMLWRSRVQERFNHETRLALYRSDLAVAQLAKASGDLGGARAALQRQIPLHGQKDLRGLEWDILAREVRGEGRPFEAITNAVAIRKIAVDPGGRWVAASFIDDRVGVWELETGKFVRVFDNAKVLGGFAPDGRIVVDEPVRALRYEPPTGEGPVTRIETGQRLVSLLPDGRALVVSPSGDLIVSLLNSSGETSQTFNLTREWPEFGASGLDIASDGASLAVGLLREDGATRRRMLSSVVLTENLVTWETPASGRIIWIRAAPDSKKFAVNIGGLTPTVFSFGDPNGAIALRGHTARVHDAAFSRDGHLLATAAADQTVRVWNVSTGQELAVLHGVGRPATAVAWTPDGNMIIAGDDSSNLRAFVFPPQKEPTVLSGLYGDVHGDLIFSPDGATLAVTATTGSVALISTSDLKYQKILTNIFQPITFVDEGKSLLAFATDWSLRKINIAAGEEIELGSFVPAEFTVEAWAVSPDGKRAVLTKSDGTIVVIDLNNTMATQVIEPDEATVWALAFAPDSTDFWTGSASGKIRRRALSDARPMEELATGAGEVQALAISGDRRWLAAAIFDDASIRIWDRQRSKWVATLLTHRRFVQSLIFTPNSDRLISGGVDGRVVVWRVPEFEEIAAFEVEQPDEPTGDEGISVLKLAPNRSSLAALMEDGRIRIWRTERAQLPDREF